MMPPGHAVRVGLEFEREMGGIPIGTFSGQE